MNNSPEAEIVKFLKSHLSPGRRRHAQAVANYARELAHLHGGDVREAYRAGLAHDAVKEWSASKLLAYVKNKKLVIPSLSFIRENAPVLLHSYVGADVAVKNKWINSAAAKKAIASHTLGALNMGLIEKILYVADYASLDRIYPGVAKFRTLARRDIDKAFQEAFLSKMAYTMAHRRPLHPLTVKIWNSFTSCRP